MLFWENYFYKIYFDFDMILFLIFQIIFLRSYFVLLPKSPLSLILHISDLT